MRCLFVALCLTLPLGAAETRLADLAWMTGHWSATIDGVEMEEVWLAPSAGMMPGLHRDAKGGRGSFEFFRIAETNDGIVYFAQPNGQPPTPFALAKSGPSRAVFANPEHDFPKRIIYELRAGKLCARVEGDGEQTEEWCWSKRP